MGKLTFLEAWSEFRRLCLLIFEVDNRTCRDARKTGAEFDFDNLAASIAAHGLLGLTQRAPVFEAVCTHAARAGEKLRQHGLAAGQLTAFTHTSPHRPGPQHHGARTTRLMPMTDDTRDLAGAARRCIEAAWRDGFAYVKAGVILDDLRSRQNVPATLFDAPHPESEALMQAMDQLNSRFGRNAVFPASAGIERAWKLKTDHHSPCWTTRLDDVPAVRAV